MEVGLIPKEVKVGENMSSRISLRVGSTTEFLTRGVIHGIY